MIRAIEINGEELKLKGKDIGIIKSFNFNSALNLKRRNRITVVGQGSILVEIHCFVYDPPPPGFRSCPECGTLKMESGVTCKCRTI